MYQKAEGYDQYIDDVLVGEDVEAYSKVTDKLPLVFKELGLEDRDIGITARAIEHAISDHTEMIK